MSETNSGSMFGPYEVVSELGRGSMAVVWRAYDPMLNRFVAIKEPLIPQLANARVVTEFKERFAREAQAVGKLDHPSIVPVYAAGVWDGRAGIVMQLVDGELLSVRIQRGGLPLGLAISVIDELLGAVSYAHEQGVIHRDLKPENIFLANSGRIRLTDFGVAHIGFMSGRTTAGAMLGTPAYMAPEQMDGKPIDVRADLFSIGVIAYVLLTGVSPFQKEGDRITEVIRNVTLEQPQPPLKLKPGLPSHLSAAVMKALEKNRSNRFASAEEMRRAWKATDAVTGRVATAAVLATTQTVVEVAAPADVTLLEVSPDAPTTLLEIEDPGLTLLELPPEDELFTALSFPEDSDSLDGGEHVVEKAAASAGSVKPWRRALLVAALAAFLVAGAWTATTLSSRGTLPDGPVPPSASDAQPEVYGEPTITPTAVETQAPDSLPTTVAAKAFDSTITKGAKAKVTARLIGDGDKLSGLNVIIEWSRDRKSWKKLALGTAIRGAYSFSWKPSSTGYYRARFAGTDEYKSSKSGSHKLTVRAPAARTSPVATAPVKKPASTRKSPASDDSKFVETR